MDLSDPNVLQRIAANPEESAWVAASAGSGKTKVLSDRVLNLLLTGTPPEKILCLTFTRTAAAQMANRIAARLAKWASTEEETLIRELTDLAGTPPDAKRIAQARRLFARLLDTAGGLKITTLHGFCQSLLKRFPLEAGISPQFDILDEIGAKELIAQAQKAILSRPEYEDALDIITAVTTEDGFLDVLTEMTLHLPALKRINRHYSSLRDLTDAYEKMLDLPVGSTPDSLTREFCRLEDERYKALKQAADVLSASAKKTDREKAEKMYPFLAAAQEDRPDLAQQYVSVFLTGSGTIRDQLACKESAAVLPVMEAEAQKALLFSKHLQAIQNMKLSLALFRISSAILNEYMLLKNDRGVMDYDDLIAAAKALLEGSGAAAWVLFKLDGGIDHILVDEAQDTSPDQWAIIKALAEEFFAGAGLRQTNRTLFAVGDKKQSIFSFQGAVPEEFEQMRQFFKAKVESAGKAWNDVPMYISFRSVPAVIDAVNFVLRFDPARSGVAEPDENVTHISWRKKQAGLIEVWPTEKPEENDAQRPFTKPVERVFSQTPSARLARKIAQKIADMLDSKEMLESAGRPIQAGDILILVRRRNSFINDLSRELKTRGVPVSGVDRLKITSHIAVKDLMALGDVLLLPEDDLALATVLRSPLCGVSADDLSAEDLETARRLKMPLDGVSEKDLFALAYNRGKTTLFNRLRTYENQPETPLGKACSFIKDLLSRVDKMRPYELYSYILGPLGRQKAFVSRLGIQALDALDEFLSLALQHDQSGPPSLQSFLSSLRQNDVEIKRDPEQSGLNAVRIMTVHAAKGLQAPIVFLPDTRQLKFFSPKTFWPKNGNDEMFFWAPSAQWRTDLISEEIERLKEKNQREYNRLLYVALTRAADRLYITGWDTSRNAKNNWYDLVRGALSTENPDGTLSYRVQEVQTDLFEEPVLRLSSAQEIPPIVEKQDALDQETRPLPEWIAAAAPKEPTPPRPLAPSRPDVEEPACLSPLTQGRIEAMRRGQVIHALLEILPQYPIQDHPAAAEKVVSVQMPSAKKSEREALIHDVLTLLNDSAASDLFAASSLAEVPVSGVVGSRVINGRIDRISVSDQEVRLIDYKTGRFIPASVKETPAAYLKQMAAYRALMAEIYPDKQIRCFLLWTEAPKLMDITEAVCDIMEY
ncbi:MAG: UvrD-helicase domain-containing protein [Alphaproteobacteria bacterium]|nr:UvrD-helicase domain-containing protein [Alphaproteobacteria bacterium]